ncbi:MAG TPA: excinuclease ABC subunit UvrA [Sphingobacterium sp.]|nr:excinuclease ABC subunit UvrA [Sphingobacterium sp.]
MKRKEVDLGEQQNIEVYGARVHNLKNIDVSFPRNQLVVVTGLSGSGKSSLAFDTIYAEGQRRYMETFSAYSRQFLGNMERPDVDKITGLSPVISIEQKTTSKNPRSTVGTITEVYDFLRLLFARAGVAYSHASGKVMKKMSDEEIVQQILTEFKDQPISILAPIVKGRKGHYRELFEQIRKQGYSKVRVDGDVLDVVAKMQVDRYKTHDIEIIVDRLQPNANNQKRLHDSLLEAMKTAKGVVRILPKEGEDRFFSQHLMDPEYGISYDEPQPNTFSFNSPYGACPKCDGLGYTFEIDVNEVIVDKSLSIHKGALAPLGRYKESWVFEVLKAVAKKYDFTLKTPIEKIPDEHLNILLFGDEEPIPLTVQYGSYGARNYKVMYSGLFNFLEDHTGHHNLDKGNVDDYRRKIQCPTCKGARLKKESLFFRLHHKNISELASMSIAELFTWFDSLEGKLNKRQKVIATEIIKEIKTRLQFLLDVGLSYLSLNRSSRSLSGGEAQRIRLATQIGSQLVNVLYILDEPSIGLHQRDNEKLIKSLKNLRDIGNSVLVVEHDKEMIMSSDYVIDMGPNAGLHGGKVVAQGTSKDILNSNSLTASYLKGEKEIKIPEERRKGNGSFLELKGAKGNNLKKVNLKLPLGTLILTTGVSGSGKSSLITQTLYPILSREFYRSKKVPLPYTSIKGMENLDKVIEINQSPIGRTPRSNPSTYTGVFTDIRSLFGQLPEAKIRGYKPGRFSFNVKGGRCETCRGAGMKIIEMNFLPDVQVPCETCHGKRYNRETLEIRYRGKSIADVLDMSINEAVDFFENIPNIYRKIKTLQDVGLGYLTLGQSSTTLSGGEAQRVKLATELSKRDTGKTFYILDEPTTGLHFEDVNILMGVINRLVERGNTVLIIEHNLDVIKCADWLIDMGPEGGKNGGEILFSGTPEQLVKNQKSETARFLKTELPISEFSN